VHFSRAEAAVGLHQERLTLSAVVDGTGDGIVLLDPDGTVAVWNPAMTRLSGIATDDAVGRAAVDVLDAGPWQTEGVHDVIRPATDAVWRVSVARVDDAAVAAGGSLFVVAVHDVTADRRTQRARDDMLAIVSHELRTPLTPIMASAQLLRRRGDRLDDAQRAALLSQIEDRAGHLARLVDDLLLVGQLSAATPVEPSVTVRPTPMDTVVVDAVEAMRLARPHHDLRTDVPVGLVALTDPVRLRQVIDNLLDNACKFSPPGSAVDVRVTAADAAVVLSVTDHGRGIPPADLDRVFEQFARVEDPLTMTTSGAGLGLFIVRELVAAMGGRLDLDSAVGVGTTVTVRLPEVTASTPVLGLVADV
jgi:signal transduction histidine kinase